MMLFLEATKTPYKSLHVTQEADKSSPSKNPFVKRNIQFVFGSMTTHLVVCHANTLTSGLSRIRNLVKEYV